MCETDTQIVPKMGKVCRSQGFGEYVSDVVQRANAKNFHLVKVDKVANGMVADTEVFNLDMLSLVFSKLACSVIVTIKRGCIEYGHIEAIEELAEKENFMGGIVDGNIFEITTRVGSMLLFM